MIDLLIVGCFVLVVAAIAGGLIIAGIKADKMQLDGYPENGLENIRI